MGGVTNVAQSGRAQKHRMMENRTEANEGGGLGEAFPAYGAGDDDARILHAGPEPAAGPARPPSPGGRQAGAGNEKPVRRGENDRGVEDDSGAAVHGAQGAGAEGRRRDVDTEQLVAERVHGAHEGLEGGEFATRGEGRIGGKSEWAGWDGAVQPRAVVWRWQGGRGT